MRDHEPNLLLLLLLLMPLLTPMPLPLTPDLPLPGPPVPSQQALIGQAALRGGEPDARARPDAPVTEAERTLKPYGIAMLPERASDHGAGSGQRDG